MKASQNLNYDMSDYFRSKGKLELNEKLNQYFTALEKMAEGISTSSHSTVISEQMASAFQQLDESERRRYLFENIQYIKRVINNRISKANSTSSNYQDAFHQNKLIETTCQFGRSKVFSCFKVMDLFFLDKNKKIIRIKKRNDELTFNLRRYLVRKSHKNKTEIILILATNPSHNQLLQPVRLIFSKAIAESIYEEIWSCIMSYRNEDLLFLLNTHQGQYFEKNQRVFLNHKNYKQLMIFKEKAISEAKQASFQWYTLYEKAKTNGQSIVISQNRVKDQYIKLQAGINKSAKNVKQQFLQMMDDPTNKNRLIKESSVLEEYQGIYEAVYQNLLINERPFKLLFIKDSYPTKDTLHKSNKADDIMFIKAIQNILVINFLEFMLVSVTPNSQKRCSLTIFCSFNLNHIINFKLAKLYLLSLINENNKLQNNSNDSELKGQSQKSYDNFKNKNELDEPELVLNEQEIFFDFGEPSDDCMSFYSIANQSFTGSEISEKTKYKVSQKTSAPLKTQKPTKETSQKSSHFYDLNPIQSYSLQNNLLQQHYLFKDWKRRKNGGVTCVNEKMLENQKKILKQVITTMGSQIFKGGNILNVSLPVSIFKKQSHIQMLAKNMVYAPLLLQNRKEKLERIKFAILFAISFSITGISLDKPFFTFLGETTQFWIGGCPVYVEQITRYPPISAYLFIGRGFRIHGKVDPKVSFGMNGVKGYSQLPIHIQFNDGTDIEFIAGKMVINNLLIGERQFNFYDKIYVFDKKNFLFGEVNFGARQKRLFGKDEQPSDFVYGSISEVSADFIPIFQKQIPRQYPQKKHIIKGLSEFEGIWNEKMYFDKKQYYDFRNNLPCTATLDSHPLPSDSSFRPELIKLIEGNIQQSQRLKIIAEESQRRDRKLRKQHAGPQK